MVGLFIAVIHIILGNEEEVGEGAGANIHPGLEGGGAEPAFMKRGVNLIKMVRA
jgi:hypothetical protein